MYALPVILRIFSLKKTLEYICERLLHCRLIVLMTWTRYQSFWSHLASYLFAMLHLFGLTFLCSRYSIRKCKLLLNMLHPFMISTIHRLLQLACTVQTLVIITVIDISSNNFTYVNRAHVEYIHSAMYMYFIVLVNFDVLMTV